MRKILVVGSEGGLGRAICKNLKSRSFGEVIKFDYGPNATSTDLIMNSTKIDWSGACKKVIKHLHGTKIDAVLHAAGGFIPGTVSDDLEIFEQNWKMNARSAFFSAHIASRFLKSDESFLMLTGAEAAFDNGPSFALGYGLAKSATHHLAKSVRDDFKTLCILPGVLDTVANRDAMPEADRSNWTNLDDLAQKVGSWCEKPESIGEELFVKV